MAWISHLKTREVEVDYFHFYGCSLPAGHELTDPQTPDAPQLGGMKLFETQKKNKELSFPATISNMFGVPFSNRAQYGCSNGTSKFYLVEDVLRHKIKRNQAIFFCVTSMFRLNGFDCNNGKALSWQLTEAADRFGKQDFLEYNNDFKILYDYLIDLWEVTLIAKTLGCPLFFIPMFHHTTFTNFQTYLPYNTELPTNKVTLEWDLIRPLKNIIRELDAYTVNIMPFMLYTNQIEMERNLSKGSLKNPGMHPIKEIHDLYGKDVVKLLKIDK